MDLSLLGSVLQRLHVSNEDRSRLGIESWDATPTPAGFVEIVSDDFPVLGKSLARARIKFTSKPKSRLSIPSNEPG